MAWLKFQIGELAEAFFSPLARTTGAAHFIMYTFMLITLLGFGVNAWQKLQLPQVTAAQIRSEGTSREELDQQTRDQARENSNRIDNQESRITILQDRVTSLMVEKATLQAQQASTDAHLTHIDAVIGNLWWEMLILMLPLDVGIFYFLISKVREGRVRSLASGGAEEA